MSNEEQISIDSILDGTLDDLADVPAFKPFPAGSHRCTVTFEAKKVSDIPSIEMSIVGIETVELSNEGDTPIAAGDKTSVLYMLKKKDGSANELGQGQLKANILAPLQAHFGTASNPETLAAAQNCEVLLTTKVRTDKRDADNLKYYTDVVALQVV